MLRAINYKDDKNIAKDFAGLCQTAFPWNEVPPIKALIKRANREELSLLCFYDEEDFVGLAYLVENEKRVYLFLLAVSENKRNQHYGTKILDYLKDKYKGRPIFLSYEEVATYYKNYQQRKKRKAFYDRNGFFQTNLKTKEFFVKYQVAASDKNAKITFKEYAELLNKIFGKFWVKLAFKERKY